MKTEVDGKPVKECASAYTITHACMSHAQTNGCWDDLNEVFNMHLAYK